MFDFSPIPGDMEKRLLVGLRTTVFVEDVAVKPLSVSMVLSSEVLPLLLLILIQLVGDGL